MAKTTPGNIASIAASSARRGHAARFETGFLP
jgi:hypothetical protein